jgi:macrolide-specific efflux system membrane fusion protein
MINRDSTRRPWHLYLLTAVAVLLAALAVADIGPPASSARTSTQIVTAQNGLVQSTATGSGNIEAGTDLDVNFQTSGTLSNVDVKVGQHVNKGQLLATLNQTSARLALDQAEQSLTAAEDQLSTADSGTTTTSGSGASSSTGTTSSAASVASAQAAVDSAQAGVDNAESALSNTKLYAPISGTIVSLASLSPGDTVSAGSTGNASTSGTSSASTGTSSSTGSSTGGSTGTTAGSVGGSSSSTSSSSSSGASTSSPFAEIVNTRTMTMTVAFGESDVNKLKVGQTATVTPDALSGVELGAHVTSISPLGTTSSNVVSYDATLTLDQSDSSVKPGMSASAAVFVAQAQGVNVPNAAVTGNGSLATVTDERNGKQTQQQVAVGLRGDSRTQIISGLSAGDQVVIKTTLPPLSSATTSTTSGSNGTLGGTGARPGGGFGGGGGGFAGGGGAGGSSGAAGGRATGSGGAG